MNKPSFTSLWSSVVVLLLLISSCKHKEDEYHSITDKIKAESKNYHGTSISSEKFTDHIDKIEISSDGKTFYIPDRKGKITSFACTECHSKPLQKMQSKDIKKAHWNIKINHASKEVMNCVTCHNSKNMDNLQSLTGSKIDFNRSFNLCSQCHQKQHKDWAGGAHGKRIGGWAKPRVSLTCVNCHNPHSPAIDAKWPARFNTQKVIERK